jgi:hypothetical protein
MACMIQFLITKNPKATRKTGAYFAPDKMLLSQVPDPSQAWCNAIQAALAGLMKDGTEPDVIDVNNSSEDGEDSVNMSADDAALPTAVGEQVGWITAVFDLASNGFIHIGGVNPADGILRADGRVPDGAVALLQYAARGAWTSRNVFNGTDCGKRTPYKLSFLNYVQMHVESLFTFVYG